MAGSRSELRLLIRIILDMWLGLGQGVFLTGPNLFPSMLEAGIDGLQAGYQVDVDGRVLDHKSSLLFTPYR